MDRGLPSRTSLDGKYYAAPVVGTGELTLNSGKKFCVELKRDPSW